MQGHFAAAAPELNHVCLSVTVEASLCHPLQAIVVAAICEFGGAVLLVRVDVILKM